MYSKSEDKPQGIRAFECLAYFMLSDIIPSLMNIEITVDLIVHEISYN